MPTHAVINDTTELLADLSSVYFEMIRDTLYSESKDDQSRAIIIAVLQSVSWQIWPLRAKSYHALIAGLAYALMQCLDSVSQSLAPIAPYMAEEIYSHRTDIEKTSPSVFGRSWRSPVRDASLAQRLPLIEANSSRFHLM